MLPTTMVAVRSILLADPSVSPVERNRLVALMRQRAVTAVKAEAAQVCTGVRLMRRGEVAERLSVTPRTVDRLAKSGALLKRMLPGRKRASGFLESDLVALLTGGGAA